MVTALRWLVIEKLLRLASGVLISTAVARYLGPAEYGSLAVAIGIVGIAAAAANMGADHIMLAELSRACGPQFLVSAFATRLGWAIVCGGAICVFAFFFDVADVSLYVALVGSVIATAPAIFTQQLYAGRQFRIASMLAVAALVVAALARLVGISQGYGLDWFAWCVSLEAGLLAIGVTVWVANTGQRLRTNAFALSEAWRYLRLCGPTLISAVLVALYFRAELFVVSSILGSEAAGEWSAAMMFITPWGMASAAFLPVINRQLVDRLEDGGAYSRAMVRLVRLTLLLAIVCVVVNVVAVQVAVPLLLGPKFAKSTTIAMVSSVALIPVFLGAVQDVWLAQQRRTSTVLRKVIIGLPLSLGLLSVGAQFAGLLGVAIGMVLSYIVTAIVLNAVFDREFFQHQLAAIGIRRV